MTPKHSPEPPAEPAERKFRMRQSSVDAGVVRVSFGSSPRVSVGAGETYTAADPRLVRALARHPHLEEHTDAQEASDP